MKIEQKIGTSKGRRRVCLWNRSMIDAGFSIGKPITINAKGNSILVRLDKHGNRKVSGVMNHGNRLPVIDLKETRLLSLAGLGEIGQKVYVKIEANKITITGANAAAMLLALAA